MSRKTMYKRNDRKGRLLIYNLIQGMNRLPRVNLKKKKHGMLHNMSYNFE